MWVGFLAGVLTRPLIRFSRAGIETSPDGRGRVFKAEAAAGRCFVKSLLCSGANGRMKVEESWHIWAIKFSLELVVLEVRERDRGWALDYHSSCKPQGTAELFTMIKNRKISVCKYNEDAAVFFSWHYISAVIFILYSQLLTCEAKLCLRSPPPPTQPPPGRGITANEVSHMWTTQRQETTWLG